MTKTGEYLGRTFCQSNCQGHMKFFGSDKIEKPRNSKFSIKEEIINNTESFTLSRVFYRYKLKKLTMKNHV